MKMMKKIIYLLFVFCSTTTLFAQKKTTVKEGNDLFKIRSYVKAAEVYEKVKPSREVLQNLGDCYYYNFQMENATKAYKKLFETYKDSVQKEVYFRYANALKGTKALEKGDSIMKEYLGQEQNTQKFMKDVSRNSAVSYKLEMMSKDKNNGDFGISFYGDKVAFSSARNGLSKSYGWNEKPYLDLFSATVDDKGQLMNVTPFPEIINSKFHESNATFTPDGKIMYFDRSGDKQVKVGDEEVATIKIFKAQFKDGKWIYATKLPMSNDAYSVEHPCLTKDGKQMYFASDMPGGSGSMDLYVVDIDAEGIFGTPRNLGTTINTAHREQFPFVTADGTLYFASDGHQGNGNLDIFMSKKISDTEYETPVNLGSTINSEMDDFNYILG